MKGRGKSPGSTPRNTISKNLARLGLLDSPAKNEAVPKSEDFFHQYAEGRDFGLSEEDVRANIASERGKDVREVTAEPWSQAVREQERGQPGLTKFIRVWQQKAGVPLSPATSSARISTPSSWEVVEGQGTTRPSPSKDSGSTPSTPVRISSPAIFGQEDRKAGAAVEEGKMDEIARAIQFQTAEIASLVKTHTEGL